MISKTYGFKIQLSYVPNTQSPNYVCISNGGDRKGFVWNVRLDSKEKLFTDKELETNRISNKRLSYLLKTYVSVKDIVSMARHVLKDKGELQDFYRDILLFMGGEV